MAKKDKEQSNAPRQTTDDTTAAERYGAPVSSDAGDYEYKEVKDSPVPGHVEQVRKGE